MPDNPAPRVTLPPSIVTVEFISDLHLSPEMPRTLGALQHYLDTTRAGALFILGDLFEVWVGDDAMAQPFERHCIEMLRRAADRAPLYIQRGNRDFLIGPAFFASTGAIELEDPTALLVPHLSDSAVLLTHGDALCIDDIPYQAFRAQVRTPAWQSAFLARPLAERQAIGAQMRAASRAHQAEHAPVTYADADPDQAANWLAQSGANVLVHGHTHRPQSELREGGWWRHVLSDWDCDHGDVPRAEALRWTRQGFERVSLAAA